MSRIEDMAKEIALPLMLGKPCILKPQDQQSLASLIALITTRLEFTDTESQAVPTIDRDTLRKTLAPTEDWSIWIARYGGADHEHHAAYHHGLMLVPSPSPIPGPVICNTQATTLVIGKLCAHAFSSTIWKNFGGYQGVALTRIWPALQSDVDSKLLPFIGDREVVELAESLARELRYV